METRHTVNVKCDNENDSSHAETPHSVEDHAAQQYGDRPRIADDKPDDRVNGWLEEGFKKVGRPTFLHINLDTMLNNVKTIRSYLAPNTGIIAVVKGNAYGHGSVHVTRFLETVGISCFAVANAQEGLELRTSGIQADILVLTPAKVEEIPQLMEGRLVPTVADMSFLAAWCSHLHTGQHPHSSSRDGGHVMISVDTGMTATGCHLGEFPHLMQLCDNREVPVHSIMTHLVDSWADVALSRRQLDMFLQAVQSYRKRGVKVHVANTCAVYHGIGVDLDFVRTGVAIYGQPLGRDVAGRPLGVRQLAPSDLTDSTADSGALSQAAGFRPVLSWYARCVRTVVLERGQTVGYCKAFVGERGQRIAVLPVGYTDGYSKCLSKASVTTPDGVVCPVVGTVSMDSISVLLPHEVNDTDIFCLVADDYNDVTSTSALAAVAETTTSEMCVRLNSKRLSRLYRFQGSWFT